MDTQTFLSKIITFLNESIVPFILALAFLIFLWNITRYFIIEGGNEKEHEKAKSLALWGIMAFVIILSLWGIVNVFVDGFGFGGGPVVEPDYMSSGGAKGSGVGSGGLSGGANGVSGDSDACIGHDYSQGPC